MVVDTISGLQAASHHLMGQTSLLPHSPSLCLSVSHSFPQLPSTKISSSKQDLIMPIDKVSKYSFSLLKKYFQLLGLTSHTHTHNGVAGHVRLY